MTLRLNGSTSGYTEIDAPAVAGSNTIVLPSGNGSANQFLKNGSTAGTLGWSSMVEDGSGRIGVGTSSPSYRIDLASSDTTAGLGYGMRLRENATAGAVAIQFTDSGATAERGYIAVDSSNNLKIATGSTEGLRLDSSGNLRFNSGYGSVATAYGCRAWVVHTNTGAITASGNVSSVTKVSTGNWTINFTNALSDNKYATVGCNDGLLGGYNFVCQTGSNFGAGQRSTTACSVAVVSSNGAGTDTGVNHWAFFR